MQSYGFFALNFYPMRSIYLQNLKLISLVVSVMSRTRNLQHTNASRLQYTRCRGWSNWPCPWGVLIGFPFMYIVKTKMISELKKASGKIFGMKQCLVELYLIC
jgi:hypothetical protein